jgi:hypothetical protein
MSLKSIPIKLLCGPDLDSPDRYRPDYGPEPRGRGDYRYQRDIIAIAATGAIKEIIATNRAEEAPAVRLMSLGQRNWTERRLPSGMGGSTTATVH